MKKVLLLFICLLFFGNAKGQYVTIPDANFVVWLQANVPSAMNGNQMDTTSVAVTGMTTINFYGGSIADLNGIQYFSSLDYLACNNLHLSNLPKLPNSVTTLDCGVN